MAGPTIPSLTARRRSEEIIMLIGHQPKEFLLAVEGLTVSFDGFKAVNDLSFYVEENEIRVIIGPNGAGKTTVLDLICGKTKATSGSIEFRGKELTKLKENQIVKAGVGRKFQTPSIYDDLTVFENLELSLVLQRAHRNGLEKLLRQFEVRHCFQVCGSFESALPGLLPVWNGPLAEARLR
jgi:ABC-type uncharacterized transport system ATPase subunit